MLAGRPPFDGPSDFAIQAQHINAAPPSLTGINPEVSKNLEMLVMTALEKKPAARFSGCGEFGVALQEALRAPEIDRQHQSTHADEGERDAWVLRGAVVVDLRRRFRCRSL